MNVLLAAKKYNIFGLYENAIEFILTNLSINNAMEVLAVAYQVQDDFLLKTATEFIINNRGRIKKRGDWDKLQEAFPEIATKVIDLVVFRDQ